MVAVKERWHIASALLAIVYARFDNVCCHVGRNHAKQDQLVAVGVPERRGVVIAEVSLYHVSKLVAVFSIHVAAEVWIQESAVEGGIEHCLLLRGAATDVDMTEKLLPGTVGILSYLFEALPSLKQLGLQIGLGILDADE